MNQGERVKEVRKALDMTLEKFGTQLGVTKVAISRIEKGERNLTEQMIKAICREFNVDYIWLTTGEGQMFMETDNEIHEMIDRIMVGENNFYKNVFKTLALLSKDELVALESIFNKFLEVSQKDKEV